MLKCINDDYAFCIYDQNYDRIKHESFLFIIVDMFIYNKNRFKKKRTISLIIDQQTKRIDRSKV